MQHRDPSETHTNAEQSPSDAHETVTAAGGATLPDISVRLAFPLAGEAEKHARKVSEAITEAREASEDGTVRLRVVLHLYRPNGRNKKGERAPHYWALPSEAVTVDCRTVAAIEYVRQALRRTLAEMDGALVQTATGSATSSATGAEVDHQDTRHTGAEGV